MCEERNFKSKFQTLCGLLVWIAVLIFMAATAAGEAQQGQTEAVPEEGEVVFEGATEGGEAKPIQSITFKKDMKIRDALRFLATKYQKNIVPSSSVDGMITVTSLYNVTFDEALKSILGYGFKYVQDGNFIKVYSNDEYKKIMEDPGRMITKVFTLYYVSAAEAVKLIAPVISSVGTVQGSSPAATILPTGESISTGSAGGDTMALNDTVVVRDYPEKVAEAEKLIKELDVRPKQVLVEATILSALLDENTQFGIDWNTLSGVAISGLSDIAASGGGAEAAGFAAEAGTSGLRVGVTRQNVTALITALEEITDTTILANPKILAVNKQLGQVYIGKKIGYVSQTTQTQTSTTQLVEFLETGTKLAFRPYIGNDGYIRMDIQPKDSSGTLKLNNIPDETSTELATNIMVKDGETVVIGGLFRENVKSSRNQIPILGQIPLIGFLFRGTFDETNREEVIVMLTPHIVEEPSETEGEKAAEDIARKGYGARMGLQWISVRRLAEERYSKAMKLYQDGDNKTALYELGWSLALRPTYLEALRLQERIINDVAPNELSKTEQIMLGLIQQEKGM